jgi:hypothetical protein
MLLSKVPAEEHAPAFLGLGVVGDQAKTPLTLIMKGLELRHEIADPHSKGALRNLQNACTDASEIRAPLSAAALMSPLSQGFVARLERFVTQHGMPLVQHRSGERKDAVITEHLRRFAGEESVLFVGKAAGVDARLPTEKRQEPCRSALANVGRGLSASLKSI